MKETIRNATPDDAPGIGEIYNYYVEETVISFEETPISSDEVRDRMKLVADCGLPWLVLEEKGIIRGYAYASRWHVRVSYRHSVESSVYLRNGETGKGYGRKLYARLIEMLKENSSVHTVIGGIALPNPPSVGLHESFGFEKTAHYREIGFKFGQWIDVGYWQLML